MASANPTTVTVSEEHFKLLLQRANIDVCDQGTSNIPPGQLNSVACLPMNEYEDLVLTARKYGNLTRNLVGGGATQENLEILSQDVTSVPQVSESSITVPPSQQAETSVFSSKQQADTPYFKHKEVITLPTQYEELSILPSPMTTESNVSIPESEVTWSLGYPKWKATGRGTSVPSLLSQPGQTTRFGFGLPLQLDTPSQLGQTPQLAAPSHVGVRDNNDRIHRACPRKAMRSIMLTGLADKTTYWDVTSAIRGAPLVDINMEVSERRAKVSFVFEEDAVRFFEHAERNTLYIKNQMVIVRQAKRHYALSSGVTSAVDRGATRNIVIRDINPELTENVIRDDMEHVYMLIIIKVDYVGRDCHVKINSVNYAMFAKSCMLSRVKYKNSRIDWDVDECDQPIEDMQKAQP
ncbi:hypothetical protein F4677DRAFT_461356 [Hypoxylon crocopeplum]|nr:hypothetical protein F4677DRAFT_461356 [Hypoxylon crocopeplum]